MTFLFPSFKFGCQTLSLLITVVRISNTILNRSGENSYPCVIPVLSGKDFSFSPLSMMLALGFSYSLYHVEKCSLYSYFAECYHKWVLYLIKCFFCIYSYNHVIFVFPLLYMMCYVYWFVNVVESLHSWDEAHLMMLYDIFYVFLDVFCQYFIEEFGTYVISAYSFLSFCIFIWFWN